MNSDEIKLQAEVILGGLVGYKLLDVISILNTAVSVALSQTKPPYVEADSVVLTNSVHLQRRGGAPSKIPKDPEVLEFILNIDRYYPDKALLDMLTERFGKDRAPSKSGLGRFRKNLRDQMVASLHEKVQEVVI